MGSDGFDIFVVAEDPTRINLRVFQLWLEGYTVEETLIMSTRMLHIADKTGKEVERSYAQKKSKFENDKLGDRSRNTNDFFGKFWSRITHKPHPMKKNLSFLEDNSTTSISLYLQQSEKRQLVKLMSLYLLQQYHTLDLIHKEIENPYNFMEFSRFQIPIEDKKFMMNAYYELNPVILRELFKRKRPLAIKQRTVKSISKELGIREIAVQRHVDNLRTIWRHITLFPLTQALIPVLKQLKYMTAIESTDIQQIQPKKDANNLTNNCKSGEMDNAINSVSKNESFLFKVASEDVFQSDIPIVRALPLALARPLAMQYFRICWMLHHRLKLFKKRMSNLPFTQIDKLVAILVQSFRIQQIEIPSLLVESSKQLREKLDHFKQFEEIRQKLFNYFGYSNDGISRLTSVGFGRNADQLKIISKLRAFMAFIFSFSSAKEFRKLIYFSLEATEHLFITNVKADFSSLCRKALEPHLETEDIRIFVDMACNFVGTAEKEFTTTTISSVKRDEAFSKYSQSSLHPLI